MTTARAEWIRVEEIRVGDRVRLRAGEKERRVHPPPAHAVKRFVRRILAALAFRASGVVFNSASPRPRIWS